MTRRLVSTPGGWGVVAAAVAVAAGVVAGGRLPLGAGLTGLGLAVAACVVAPAGRARALATLAILLACGAVRGAWAVPDPARVAPLHRATSSASIDGRVRDAGDGHSFVLDAQRLAAADGSVEVAGGVLVRLRPGAAPVHGGDLVRVEGGTLRPPDPRPGPQSAERLDREGVVAVATGALVTVEQPAGPGPATALDALRARLVEVADHAVAADESALLLGVAYGIHRPLPAAVSAPLQDAGLVHLVAVSGLKVAVLLALLLRLGEAAAWSPRRRTAVALVTVGLYVLVGGASPAAVRSLVMAGSALCLRPFGRRPDPLPMLAGTGALLLVVSPAAWGDIGFGLTFLGTLGILLLAGPIARRIPGPRLLVDPFALTVAAQLATAPLQASTFGSLSLAGPVANALVLPLLPVLLVLAVLAALVAVVAPPLAVPVLGAAGVGVRGIVLLSRAVAAVPGAAVHVAHWTPAFTAAWLAVPAVVVLLARRRGRRPQPVHEAARSRPAGRPRPPEPRPGHRRWVPAATGLVLAACVAASLVLLGPDGRIHVSVLDGVTGSATVIRARDGGTALVGAPADGDRLPAAVAGRLPAGTHSLDLVVLAGTEPASAGGLAALTAHLAVRRILLPAVAVPAALQAELVTLVRSGVALVSVAPGRAWTWDGLEWRCLPLAPPARGTGPACAIEVGWPGARLLVLGTAPPVAQDELAGGGRPGRIDVLVAPATGGVAASLLAATRPRCLVVPAARTATTLLDTLAGGTTVRHVAAEGGVDLTSNRQGEGLT